MKIYYECEPVWDGRLEGKKAILRLSPPTNGPKVKDIIVLIANEIKTLNSGDSCSLGLVGNNKTPMIFPANNTTDKRIAVLGTVNQPGHRRDGRLVLERSRVNPQGIVAQSAGYGSWGSGEIFLVILNPGEWVVSNSWEVWLNSNGTLVNRTYLNEAEFSLALEDPEIEML